MAVVRALLRERLHERFFKRGILRPPGDVRWPDDAHFVVDQISAIFGTYLPTAVSAGLNRASLPTSAFHISFAAALLDSRFAHSVHGPSVLYFFADQDLRAAVRMTCRALGLGDAADPVSAFARELLMHFVIWEVHPLRPPGGDPPVAPVAPVDDHAGADGAPVVAHHPNPWQLVGDQMRGSASRAGPSAAAPGPKRVAVARLGGDVGTRPSTDEIGNEVRRYLTRQWNNPEDAAYIDRNQCNNPLLWWKHVGADQFPLLALVAARLFGGMGTTAIVERLASLAGDILSDERSSLSPQRLNALIMLASYCRK